MRSRHTVINAMREGSGVERGDRSLLSESSGKSSGKGSLDLDA